MAVRAALKQVIGAYAIAILEKGNTSRIIVARKSSPMAIGIGDGEYFLSSDAASIIDYTQNFVYLNDNEIAIIEKGKPLHIMDLEGQDSQALYFCCVVRMNLRFIKQHAPGGAWRV